MVNNLISSSPAYTWFITFLFLYGIFDSVRDS